MAGTGRGADPLVWGRRAALGLVVVVYVYVLLMFAAIFGTASNLEAKLFGLAALLAGIAVPVWVWYNSPLVRSLW